MREKLEKLLDRYIGSDEISGASVLLYKDGREYLSLQKGYADTMAGIPYSNDTLIRLYSMTKPITSAAVMILIERGLLERLDPVSDFILFCVPALLCTGREKKARFTADDHR